MTWEFYEVWGVDEDGNEDLLDTTRSLKEAKQLAEINILEEDNSYIECVIYSENEDGELVEIETVVAG